MQITEHFKRNWTYYFGGVIFVSILFYGLFKELKYYHFYNDPEVELRYTIATITEFEPGAKSPPYLEYIFFVNGKKYSGSYSLTGTLRKKSSLELKSYLLKKFFVKYPVKDPQYSRLIINKPVHKEKIEIPDSGWKEIRELNSSCVNECLLRMLSEFACSKV